jgi:hypothetical protein
MTCAGEGSFCPICRCDVDEQIEMEEELLMKDLDNNGN